MIPLFKVYMPEEVLPIVNKVLLSGFIGQGPKVEEFEKSLQDYLHWPNLVTLNSGTSAIHLALRLLKIGRGSEVVSTPLTCTATNFPILLAGAKIRWADIDPHSCNIDPISIRQNITDKTRAIMIMHWGGYPCDLQEINQIGQEFNIPIIEDCAHAFGSIYQKSLIGTSNNLCAFSFQAIKSFTTVDGGMLTLPYSLLSRAKLLRWYGISREEKRSDFRCELDVIEAGDKLHMNDINATIGIEQLNHINSILKIQRDNANFYNKTLRDITGIQLLQQNSDRLSSSWLYTLSVDNRIDFMRYMKEKGITVSQVHERNDKHTCLRKFRSSLPQLESIIQKIACIPVGWWVTLEQREYIADCIQRGW